jgi:5'-methylthioadenosine phosphorylase
MCYVSVSTVTDYDVWAEKPVTAKEVMDTLSKNVQITKKLLAELIENMPEDFVTKRTCSCEKALAEAEF